MLEVKKLCVTYGQHRALEDVSVRVEPGEIAVILGANGAGKSTLLRAIGGLCEGKVGGDVVMDGKPIRGLEPHQIVENGIALVPEGRGIFGDLTVRENLLLGAFSQRARDNQRSNLDRVLDLFPKLAERQDQIVRTMSGGEQQMVAIGRAMMSNPQILMLDEPSLGLSPLLCRELFHNLTEVRQAGLGILLVEQNAKQSLAIADRGYLLENAHIVGEDTADNLIRDTAVQKAYLGASAGGHMEQAVPAGEETPPPPPQPASPPPLIPAGHARARHSASELIGRNIDDLITQAADLDATHQPPAPTPADTGRPVAAGTASHGGDLQRTLSEIEAAARAAQRPRQRSDTGAQKTPSAGSPRPNPDKPKVQVWKRPPKIEIYRRTQTRPGKSTGKLVRIKGDDDG